MLPVQKVAPRSWAGLALDRPRVMGILNVTPDSFSDGGSTMAADIAIAAGLAMAADGADIIDIGGESTRPGADPVSPAEEQQRILPVVEALAAAGLLISVDSRHAATMRAALDAGARIVNDISALTHDPDAAPLVAARSCAVVLMHMRGTPATMNSLVQYTNVVAEVKAELLARVTAAQAAGIRSEQIAIDPGIGFAKLAEQSTALLRGLPAFIEPKAARCHEPDAAQPYPLVVGVSRKSFIGRLTGEAAPRRRLGGSLAAGLFALSRGASILRVHDVRETVQAIRVWHALFE